MKRVTNNIFCLVLSFMLIAGMMPQLAFAEETQAAVAEVNDVEYFNYEDAWAAVNAGGTIKMLDDWETDDELTVPSGITLTIDMNGHTIDRGLAQEEDSESNGVVIYINKNATVNIMNGTITGGCSDTDASGIHIKEKSVVTLKKVTVTGNRSEYFAGDGHGGGIMLDGESVVLNLFESNVDSNYAEENGGGIYISDYSDCVINMSAGSTVSGNKANDGYGGGIYVNGDGAKITGDFNEKGELTCYIKDNECDNDGGGIYVNADNVTISNLIIDGNKADVDGGGIFVDNEGCAIKGCVITDNTTGKGVSREGGGIFVDNDGCSLSNCKITGNNAHDYGGGVYVTATANISLGGNMIIKDNYADGDRDNLYLHSLGSDSVYETSFILGQPTSEPGSIGVTRGSFSDSSRLTNDKGSYDSSVYFADNPDLFIYWDYNQLTGQGSRHLKMTDDAKDIPDQELPKAPIKTITAEEERINIIGDKYKGYEIIKGYSYYRSGMIATEDMIVPFYYTDGYFAEDPSKYNSSLATLSQHMAMAAGNANAGGKVDYSNKFANIKHFLADIGCVDENIYISDSYMEKPKGNSIGFAIGSKILKNQNDENTDKILVPIAIRGLSYEVEWEGNVTLGATGESQGFRVAADQVEAQLEKYIDEHGLEEELEKGNVKFWVTGFSRAGTAANLLSKRLVDKYSGTGNEVFAYCISAPQGGIESLEKEGKNYNVIHNVINTGDLVPLFVPKEMGFKRYGVDHYVPGTETSGTVTKSQYSFTNGNGTISTVFAKDNEPVDVDLDVESAYFAKRTRVIEQLATISPTMRFDDYFRLATLNYAGSYFGTVSMITEIEDGDAMNSAEWLPAFLSDFQEWAVNGGHDENYEQDYRKFYTSVHPEGEDLTTEAAVCTVIGIVFSNKDKADDILDSVMAGFNTVDQMDLWDDVVGDWDTLSDEEREKYTDDLWEALMESSGNRKGAVEYLSEEEATDLENVWPVISDLLFRFLSEDYEYEGIEGERQVHIGTLAYNMQNIFQTHNVEAMLAWLRIYDSFFTDENGKKKDIYYYEIDETKDDFQPNVPVALVEEEAAEESVRVKLEATCGKKELENEGIAIYYKIEEGAYQLYRGPIQLPEGTKITTYAMAFHNKSDTIEIGADVDPTDPTDEPTDPTDEPTDPTDEPTDPTDEPTDPDDPSNPTTPVDPDNPTSPTDDPSNPTDDPTDPTNPTNPTTPADPDNPSNPNDPSSPTDNPADPDDPDDPNNSSNSPNKTGDEFPMILLLGIAIAAGTLLVVIASEQSRRRKGHRT